MKWTSVILSAMMAVAAGCSDGDAAHSSPPLPAAPPPSVSPTPSPKRTLVKIDGREVEAPQGSVVEFETENNRQAHGLGASISTDNAEAAAKFNAGAPNTSLGGELGGSATGGEASADFRMSLPKPTSPLLWVGVVCLIGSGVALYLQLRRGAVIAGALGLGFIAAASMPGVAVFIVAVLGAGMLIVYLWAEHNGKGFFEGLRAVVSGVEQSSDDVRAAVKSEIKKQATIRDSRVIRMVKHVEAQ